MPESLMPLAGAGPHPPAGRRLTVAASGLMPGGRVARDEHGAHETGHASCLIASLLPLVYSLYVRYCVRVRKPTAPEQLYIDFDGFFAACEEQADRQLQGRPLGVMPFAGAVHSCVIAANTLAKRVGVTTGMAIAHARRRCPKIRAGPPAARSLYAHPPPYRRSGSRRAAHRCRVLH